MFWPLVWPSSGRSITKDWYVEMLEKFLKPCRNIKKRVK